MVKSKPKAQSSRPLFGLSWNPFEKPAKPDPTSEVRMKLKTQLLERCNMEEFRKKRQLVEETIQELAKFSVAPEASTSPLLKREWKLVWTTEKEINFFIERGWSDGITQTLSEENLQNMIPFKRGGGFGVSGFIRPDESNPLRTQFKFQTATLDLGKFGSYSVPPVGEGWFDTVYLDDDLRVDLNSRNDILVCTPLF
ncbi:hypothetical protein ACA910_021085 [Epithemia clementina (nom. ined.)]